MIRILFCCLIVLLLTSCDPVHELKLQNLSGENILVKMDLNKEFDTLQIGSTIRIGNCVARYPPKESDIKINFLLIIKKSETLILKSKKDIFLKLQKVDELNWRILIRDD